jgi:FAD/FMN-containing dehydrogenase
MPDDPRYPTLVRGFNLRWAGAPETIAVCHTDDEVAGALQWAMDHGRRPTVRGGGHCYEDFVSANDGGVIIHLSPMNRAWYDAAQDLYAVQGGATLWDVYRQLYVGHNVTIPGGSCASVGAGGHLTGGGYGLLSRLHGLSIDSLHAVDVVHADRHGDVRTVHASRDSSDPALQDLFWAHLGGGGGNFGIVTTFWFRDLPEAPVRARILTQAWDWHAIDEAAFAAIITNYGRWLAANSGIDSPAASLFSLLHLTHRSAGQLVLVAQDAGDDPDLLPAFAAAIGRDAPPAVVSRTATGHHHTVAPTTSIRDLPWLYATQTLNGTGPNQRGKYKSAYMKRPFPDAQVAAMWTHLSTREYHNPQALLQVDAYGGRINALPPDATAIPQRSSIMKLQYQTYWTDPQDDDRNLDWIRSFYTAMYGPGGPLPDDTMDGCYVNYPDVDLGDWARLYYQANYPRLQRAKALWDPLNVFRHAQSIALPAEAGAS